MLKDTKKVFDSNNVEFWLEHGSLLGAIREGKMIENDDDIDLAAKFKPTITKSEQISTQLYDLGYDILLTDVKLTIRKSGEQLSVFLYKQDVIPDHFMRYRISKKDFRAHILLYGFLEGLRTPSSDYLHSPTLKHRLIHLSKRIMSKLPAKEQLHNLILSFGKKIGCLFIFDIAFPTSYVSSFKKTNFLGLEVNIPVQPEKYLEWMYGKDWKTPNPKYEKQWDFYDDMENYNRKRMRMQNEEH